MLVPGPERVPGIYETGRESGDGPRPIPVHMESTGEAGQQEMEAKERVRQSKFERRRQEELRNLISRSVYMPAVRTAPLMVAEYA